MKLVEIVKLFLLLLVVGTGLELSTERNKEAVKKFNEFIEQNRPKQVIIAPLPKNVKGLIRKKENDGFSFRLRKGEGNARAKIHHDRLVVSWRLTIESDKVVFTPDSNFASEGEKEREVEQHFLNESDIKPVEVPAPEKIVELPIPPWVGADKGLKSEKLFISDAKKVLSAFEADLISLKYTW